MGTDLSQCSIAIAETKLGIKEATGHNDGPFIEDIQAWMDDGQGWMKGQPWCATFASWCMAQAAIQLGVVRRLPKFAATTALYAWFEKEGLLLPAPTPYCIGMIKGDEGVPGKTHCHTFFVESLDGDFVNGIDGNWGDAVSHSHHAIKDCDFGPIV